MELPKAEWERKKIYLVVRTYPVPARRGNEVSCTAGITEDGKWIRLFPIPYRLLPRSQKIDQWRYRWIEAKVRKSPDPRPESYEVDIDSIEVVSEVTPTTQGWQRRKNIVFEFLSPSLCSLQDDWYSGKDNQRLLVTPTLGIFKPKRIEKLTIVEESAEWSSAQLEKLNQPSIFDNTPSEQLEKIPFKFQYKFECDDDNCKGHKIMCEDWELLQSYRRWKQEYGEDWEDKFRHRYETEMIELNDTHFYVGTMRMHPHVWLIVGLWYPRKSNQLQMAI